MTIIDVFDESALSMQARASLRSHYGHAKLAHLKTGGNFPYLSRSDDVNMHLLVRRYIYVCTIYLHNMLHPLAS